MARLLMFSGGVESTALLGMMNPVNDYVGIIDFHSPIDAPDHDLIRQWKILSHYGFQNVCVCTLKMTRTNNQRLGDTSSQYQPFADLMVARMSNIDQLWWGCHAGDTHDDEKWTRYRKAFSIIHPHCQVVQPLEKLTKREQWDMIDDEVKPFVVSCYEHHPEIVDNCKLCEDRKLIYKDR